MAELSLRALCVLNSMYTIPMQNYPSYSYRTRSFNMGIKNLDCVYLDPVRPFQLRATFVHVRYTLI